MIHLITDFCVPWFGSVFRYVLQSILKQYFSLHYESWELTVPLKINLKIFQNSRSHLQILVSRIVTRSVFRNKDPSV